jgi:hypothetical protein
MNENEKNERETIEVDIPRETIEDWLREQDAMVTKEVPPETVLHEAERIIYGDREMTYGHPSKNLWTIARLWTAYVDAASDNSLQGKEFTAKDVALMMILVKTARLANNESHRDSIVDICGYAALMERCDE